MKIKSLFRQLHRWVIRLRFGKITERVVGTAGDNVPAEIENYDRNGVCVGFWAYGAWHPDSKYKGV